MPAHATVEKQHQSGHTAVLGVPELAHMQSMSSKAWTVCDPDFGVSSVLRSSRH